MTLMQLEKIGLRALNKADYVTAINCFNKIIDIQPAYEHGACYYHLACLYEDLGKYDLAKSNYEKALEYMLDNDIYLGGYASFLYLHADPKEAFAAYLKLLKVEKSTRQDTSKTLEGLNALAEKIGLSDEQLQKEISKACQ